MIRWLKNILCRSSYPDLPVYDSYRDAPINSAFRQISDPKNVIRFNSVFSENPKLFPDYMTYVAGTSYRTQDVLSFVYGKEHRIEITKEPSKKYPHALAVFGIWKDNKNYAKKAQLGYIPDNEAFEISEKIKKEPQIKILSKLGVIYLPTGDKKPGIRIDIALH